MPDPIDYSGAFSAPSPVQAFTQGLQGGLAVQQAGFQQAQMQRTMALQQALMKIGQNPQPQDIAQLSVMFPEMSEQFKRSYDMLTPVQQQQRLQAAIPVYAAVQNGQIDTAAQMLNDRADALENSGQQQEAAQTRAMAQMVQQHPQTAKLTMGTLLASTMGPDKFAQAFSDIGTQQRADELQSPAVQKAQGEANKAIAEGQVAQQTVPQQVARAGLQNADLSSQIANRAGQLALDRDKLTTETQLKLTELARKPGLVDLTPNTENLVNEAVQNSTLNRQSAAQMTDLANQIETADPASGVHANAWEWLKNTTGNQNYISNLRQEYNRLRTSQSIQSLKGVGKITDTEMGAAMKGFPSDTADASQIVPFLRGMAKMQQYSAAVDDAKSEWLTSVGSLGKSMRDVEIQGVRVPAGTTFQNFINTKIKIPGAYTQPPAAAAGAKDRLLQMYGGGQ
jgi:hypothetical protein